MRFEDGYELECNQGRTIHSGWDYGAGDGAVVAVHAVAHAEVALDEVLEAAHRAHVEQHGAEDVAERGAGGAAADHAVRCASARRLAAVAVSANYTDTSRAVRLACGGRGLGILCARWSVGGQAAARARPLIRFRLGPMPRRRSASVTSNSKWVV